MPSLSSLLTPILVAISKLSPNSTHAYSNAPMPEINNPPYLPHPAAVILPGMSEPITPLSQPASVTPSISNSFEPAPNTSIPLAKAPKTTNKSKGKAKALKQNPQGDTAAVVSAPTPNQSPTTQPTTNSTTNYETKSAQLSDLIYKYDGTRNILFEAYAECQNNATVAQYNVRQVSLSLLAAAEAAQKCGNYFEEIITDQTLTAPEIAELQKNFDAFTAQCNQDCISYKTPRQREVFYPDQVNPPANIGDIVKVLHLLQYVVNGYSKMITSETGIYDTSVIIDYTGSGGTTIETGVIRVDINMFQDLIQFLHMYAHETGHLEIMLFLQQSTRTVPSPLLTYAIPSILSQQFPNQENEAEADTNAAIVCALYDVPLDHPYTDFESQPPLPPAQADLDSHPQGIERAAIMQDAVSTLSYHFNNTDFQNNIWKEFAENVRNISGINFRRDIPTMAELLRIYALSPNDNAQQIRTLQAEYPNLFTNTTRGDYPPAPLVAVGIDKQLYAAFINQSAPFQQIRRDTPTESIEAFQQQWNAAGGKLPFPAWDTPPPSPQTVSSQVAAAPLLMSNAKPVTPPPTTVLPSSVSATEYNIPVATSSTVPNPVIKQQLFSYEQHNKKASSKKTNPAPTHTTSEKRPPRMAIS